MKKVLRTKRQTNGCEKLKPIYTAYVTMFAPVLITAGNNACYVNGNFVSCAKKNIIYYYEIKSETIRLQITTTSSKWNGLYFFTITRSFVHTES